jgi:hypothetical protein
LPPTRPGMRSWVSKLPKQARWRRRRAAVPSASSFILLENEEQFIRPVSPTTFPFLICNQIFVTCMKNEPNFRKRKLDSLHLRDSPRKRLSRSILVSSGTNPYNMEIKETLHYIITTSEYNSSTQAGYKSNRTESRKVKHLRSGSIEAKCLQLHKQSRA